MPGRLFDRGSAGSVTRQSIRQPHTACVWLALERGFSSGYNALPARSKLDHPEVRYVWNPDRGCGCFEFRINFRGRRRSLQFSDPCPADFDGDGLVNASDLAELLGHWGPDPFHPGNFTGDGAIDTADLVILLDNWGPCD